MVQTLLEHGADIAAINKVGAAGVPRASAWRRARVSAPARRTGACAWYGVQGAARESVAACRGRSCRRGTAADRTPALQDGSTSLHKASESGRLAVVQTLLEHGADVAARTKVGAAGGRACRWNWRGGAAVGAYYVSILGVQEVSLCAPP